jgi:hypothetical protein
MFSKDFSVVLTRMCCLEQIGTTCAIHSSYTVYQAANEALEGSFENLHKPGVLALPRLAFVE